MLFDIYIFNFWIIGLDHKWAIWLSPIFQNVSPVSPVGVSIGVTYSQKCLKMSCFVFFHIPP